MSNQLQFGSKVVFLGGLPLTLPSANSDPGSPSSGDMYYNTVSNMIKYYNGTSWISITGATLTGLSLNANNIIVGDGSNLSAAVDTSAFGNILADSVGALTIKSNTITNSMVSTSAAISYTKLATLSGATNGVLVQDGSGHVSATSILSSNLFLADGSVPATANLDLNSNKIINLSPGTNQLDAVNKQQLDAASLGFIALPPIADPDLIDDSLSTPPGSPVFSELYIIAASPTGAWASIGAGHAVWWNGTTWVDLLGRAVQTGDRFGVTFVHGSGSEGGGLTARHNQIVQVNDPTPGAITYTYTSPVQNNSVFVNEPNSQHFAFTFVYDSNVVKWIQFTGPLATIAGAALAFDGDVLNVLYDNSSIDVNGFNQLEVKNSGVTNAKLANMAAHTVKANITGLSAAPTDVPFVSTNTASSGVFRDGSGNFAAGQVTVTALLANGKVTITDPVDEVSLIINAGGTGVGSGVNLDATGAGGARNYQILSTGSGNGGASGPSAMAFVDVTAGNAYRYWIDSSGRTYTPNPARHGSSTIPVYPIDVTNGSTIGIRIQGNTAGAGATFDMDASGLTGGRDYIIVSSDNGNGDISGGYWAVRDVATSGESAYRFLVHSTGEVRSRNNFRIGSSSLFVEFMPLASFTLADNQSSAATILSMTSASYGGVIIEYSINRNGIWRSGQFTIANDGSATPGYSDTSASTGSVGITFSATTSGGNLLFQYTSTSTGFTGALRYHVRRW